MSRYSLAPGEALDAAFRRLMRKQLRSAARALEPGENAAVSIHRARRCLKSSRALIALLEPAYRKGRWSAETKTLKMAARELAGARDEQAKLDALDRLVAHTSKSLPATSVGRLRRALERKRAQREAAIGSEHVAAIATVLGLAGPAFRRKRVSRFDDRSLIDGVVATYRRGRKAMRTAFATGVDEAFHGWRREVQTHWRHMQLIERCWPAEIAVRAEMAKALSGLLGNDRDLWLLMGGIADPELAIGVSDRGRLLQACRSLQDELRRQAQPLGHLLYAEKPKHLGRRMRCYWRHAEKQGPSAEPASDEVAHEAQPADAGALAA